MKLNKKLVRQAIKARIDEDNEWRLYGHAGSTSWNKRLPEHHFYMRDNGLRILVDDSEGRVVDKDGNDVAKWKRKYGSKRVCLTYKELMPTIEWV